MALNMVNKAFVKETEELEELELEELEELAFEQIPMDSDVEEENASEPEISEEEPKKVKVPEISEGKKATV